jgi:hypothetical protein
MVKLQQYLNHNSIILFYVGLAVGEVVGCPPAGGLVVGEAAAFVGEGAAVGVFFTFGVAEGVEDGVTGPGVGV